MYNFIKLYDNAPATSFQGKEFQEQYAILGITECTTFTNKKVEEKLVNKILTAITAAPDEKVFMSYGDFIQLKSVFVYLKVLEHTNKYEPYYFALNTIISIGGNNICRFVDLSNEKRWTEALAYLKGYMEFHPDSHEMADDLRRKELDRAYAANRLKKTGVTVTVENNDLQFKNEFYATRILSNFVSQIGGVRFVEELLKQMPFNSDTNRLVPPVKGNDLNIKNVEPRIPYGYLLNLGLRHTSSKGSEQNLQKYFTKVQSLATDLCTAIYPVQNYTIWENIFHRKELVTEYFKRLVTADSIYYMFQSGVPFTIEICNYLIDRFLAEGITLSSDISMEEYKSFMNTIVSKCDNTHFVRLSPKALHILDDLDRQTSILTKISANIGTINPCYELPLDYNKINVSNNPLMLLPTGDLLLYPSTIGAWGWYELLMAMARQSNSQIDNIVGSMLEDLIKQKLAEKSIHVKAGEYSVDKKQGECDIVIESATDILLIEVKKKSMTCDARKGEIYKIILDIAGSLFNAQEQCHRTEAFLMHEGQITLVNHDKQEVLELNNRNVEKMALTLLDYGTLHDNIIATTILREMMSYRFEVDENEVKAYEPDSNKQKATIKGYKSLEKKQNDFNNYISDIMASLGKSPEDYHIFYDSCFYNMEQLFYVIKKSSSAENLIYFVKEKKHISYGTFDFWVEFGIKYS